MSSPAPEQAPPGPGPQHAALKHIAGTWDAVVSFAPGAPVPPMTGVETDTIECGGLWLQQDARLQTPDGMPFLGRGLFGWDAVKEKYVSVWVDSMTPTMSLFEGTADAGGKVITSFGEQPDMESGGTVKVRSVYESQGPNARTFTMYGPGPGGKEVPMMTIRYKRR